MLPNRGLVENCDGNKLPIYRVYYVEVLIYSDPSLSEFENPREIELDIASKYGKIFLKKLKINHKKKGNKTKKL